MTGQNIRNTQVEGIPVAWVEPSGPPRGLALWLTHLGGSTAQTAPMLRRLAARGLVAVSFDPPRHGRRAEESPRELARRVLADFRRRMWPLLGQYALEGGRVLDWAQERFAFDGPILAGGVSMGGDATVALAGLDSRISRVAVLAATPDWTRPGMRTIGEPDGVIDQGLPDFYARWFFDQLDPLTHLDRYAKGAAVAFECGAIDQHVPAEAAVRFRDRLRELAPTATVRVTLHAGLDHVGACRSEALYERAGDWLTAPADRNGS